MALNDINDCLNKTCLVGLSYFDLSGNLLKQTMLGGEVIKIDKEKGITLALLAKQNEAPAEFILPANLACWFKAPKGEFHTSLEGLKIIDPDYLVTWDIYQTRDDKEDGEQQWWEWVPRVEAPAVTGIC